jgi:O6-methylguanine-DNA--protein-cysteine methyltransferase
LQLRELLSSNKELAKRLAQLEAKKLITHGEAMNPASLKAPRHRLHRKGSNRIRQTLLGGYAAEPQSGVCLELFGRQ